MYDKNNPFAKIIRNEAPREKIYEDDNNLAFYSIAPKAKIHVLVIPKGEYINYEDFNLNATPAEIVSFGKAIVAVTKLLNLTSYRLVVNHGPDSGQTVFHLHYHILAGENFAE